MTDDAAAPGAGLKAGGHRPVADLLDHALQQGEVHAAHEIGVLLRERMERTVDQLNRLLATSRLVSVLGEGLAGGREPAQRIGARADPVLSLPADGRAFPARRLVEELHDVRAAPSGRSSMAWAMSRPARS